MGTVIGVGIDAVDIERFRHVLARTPGMRTRLFTADELAYADQANDPTQRLAVRFAAKEALMKALGVGLGAFRMTDVEVIRADSGRPSLAVRGAAAELVGDAVPHVSLTHTAMVAEAVVVLENSGRQPG